MIEEMGIYKSSYFIMNVPIEADLEIQKLSDEEFAIFFHEYIHFLQDITTFYGYMGVYDHGEYIRRIVNDIYKMPASFKVPIEIEDMGDAVVLNKMIAEFSLGDCGDFDFVVIKDIFTDSFFLTDTFSIPELHIKVATNSGIEDIVVGAYAIRENMAYLLEKKCTTKYRRSPDFPYQIVEILAKKMCPDMLTDEFLIALCDVSLQCSVPGYGLYQFINAISKKELVVNRPEDLYVFLYRKNTEFLGRQMKMPDVLREASQQAINHLLSYLKIDLLKKEYQDWVNYTMGAGIALRLKRPFFFLEMARDKRDRENAILKYIAKTIGSPQMVNSLGKRFQLATDRPICRFEYLEVVREIEYLFDRGKVECNLKPWCGMSPDGVSVDERCDLYPWKRCNDEQLCPYALLWKHWGLDGHEIILEK